MTKKNKMSLQVKEGGKKMMKTRRVGSITFGLCCILFGVLFLLRTFLKTISYSFIVRLWPVVLIVLGVEVIFFYIMEKDREIKYDVWAIFMIAMITIFAMGMGGMEFILEHTDTCVWF